MGKKGQKEITPKGLEKPWWEKRYTEGRTSGPGSIGRGREWKWSIIDEFTPEIPSLVDVGCGDLTFWEARFCKSYIGIDIANNVIVDNREKRPEWKFIPGDAGHKIEGIKGRVVFCLDLLFHIMNTDNFVKILENLCYYSKEWIYIYTWTINPFLQEKWQKLGKTVTDDKFQYYRPLREYLEIFLSRGFTLEATRWPPWGGIGELFVFRKSELDSLLKGNHRLKP